MIEVGVKHPACMQCIIAINWPLLILTDSPEFPRMLTIAGLLKMCGNEAKVTNKKFDGYWGNLYKQGPAPFKYFLATRIPSFLSRGEFDALWLLVKLISS